MTHLACLSPMKHHFPPHSIIILKKSAKSSYLWHQHFLVSTEYIYLIYLPFFLLFFLGIRKTSSTTIDRIDKQDEWINKKNRAEPAEIRIIINER